jgi:hypothetical protein
MELILRTDSEDKAAEVIALAKKLNMSIETIVTPVVDSPKREELRQRILAFEAKNTSEKGLSSMFAGILDKEQANKLNRELENMRNEWERDIF